MFLRPSTVMIAVLASCAALSAARSASKDVDVTSLVEDYAANIAPVLQIQSDQHGTYTNAANVSSQMQSGGNWVLDTRSSTRKVYLAFTQPASGVAPAGTPASGFYPVRILTECGSTANFLTLAGGSTVACGLHVGFDSDGQTYGIEMDPIAPNGPFPNANLANVTCIFPTSGSRACTQWSVTPSQAVTLANGSVIYQSEGALLSYSTVKGKTVATHLGDFLFSFEFVVTNP